MKIKLSTFSKHCPWGCGCCYVPLAPADTALPVLEAVDVSEPISVGSSKDEMKPTRLVLISDTHGRHEELVLPPGDVLVHSGDFVRSHKHCTREAIESFDAWLGRQVQYKARVVIAGNHEKLLDRVRPSAMLKNCKYVCHNWIEVEGLRMFCSPYRPGRGCLYRAEAFGRPARKLQELWASLRAPVDVVITHGPPFGVLDEESVGHIGDPALLDRVRMVEPLLHVFGHCHGLQGGRRLRTQTGEVLFVNAASLDGRDGIASPVVVDVYPMARLQNPVRL